MENGEAVYFSGCTRLFSIMQGIDHQYKPNTLILTIGNETDDALNLDEAAFTCAYYFKDVKVVLPIWVG